MVHVEDICEEWSDDELDGMDGFIDTSTAKKVQNQKATHISNQFVITRGGDGRMRYGRTPGGPSIVDDEFMDGQGLTDMEDNASSMCTKVVDIKEPKELTYQPIIESDESDSSDSSCSDDESEDDECFICRHMYDKNTEEIKVLSSMLTGRIGTVSKRTLMREAAGVQTHIQTSIQNFVEKNGNERDCRSGTPGEDSNALALSGTFQTGGFSAGGVKKKRRSYEDSEVASHSMCSDAGAGGAGAHAAKNPFDSDFDEEFPASESGSKGGGASAYSSSKRMRVDSENGSVDGNRSGKKRFRKKRKRRSNRHKSGRPLTIREKALRDLKRHNKYHSYAPEVITQENAKHLRKVVRMYSKRLMCVDSDGNMEPSLKDIRGMQNAIKALQETLKLQPDRMMFYRKPIG